MTPAPVASPDLIILCATPPSGPWSASTTQVLSFTVDNVGQMDAGMTHVAIFASENSVIRPTDTLLTTVPVGPIAAAGSSSISVSLTLPSALAGLTVYIGGIADVTSLVQEDREANNIRVFGSVLITP